MTKLGRKRGRPTIWTFEACKADAINYQSQREWERMNRSAYKRARLMGWLDALFPNAIATVNKSVVVFGRQFDTIRAAARHHGINYSMHGNINRYARDYECSLDEACELYIFAVHYDRAAKINCELTKTGSTAFEVKKRRCNGRIKVPELTLKKKFRRPAPIREVQGQKIVAKSDAGITAKVVASRDGFVCQICRRKVVPHTGRAWQPRGWSIGHIVAISRGGNHTWDNVQCECVECNTRKGTATYGQIALPFAA